MAETCDPLFMNAEDKMRGGRLRVELRRGLFDTTAAEVELTPKNVPGNR